MDLFGDARRGMDAQSMVHVIVALLVILGNVALLVLRRGGGSAEPGGRGDKGPASAGTAPPGGSR
jgi:hypothetical protein